MAWGSHDGRKRWDTARWLDNKKRRLRMLPRDTMRRSSDVRNLAVVQQQVVRGLQRGIDSYNPRDRRSESDCWPGRFLEHPPVLLDELADLVLVTITSTALGGKNPTPPRPTTLAERVRACCVTEAPDAIDTIAAPPPKASKTLVPKKQGRANVRPEGHRANGDTLLAFKTSAYRPFSAQGRHQLGSYLAFYWRWIGHNPDLRKCVLNADRQRGTDNRERPKCRAVNRDLTQQFWGVNNVLLRNKATPDLGRRTSPVRLATNWGFRPAASSLWTTRHSLLIPPCSPKLLTSSLPSTLPSTLQRDSGSRLSNLRLP